MSKPLQHQSHVLDDDAAIAVGFHPLHGGVIGGQQSPADGVVDITNAGGAAGSHYGVLGTCHSALAYYEAAAHGIMDELESGPTKGKVVSALILFWAMYFLFYRICTHNIVEDQRRAGDSHHITICELIC